MDTLIQEDVPNGAGFLYSPPFLVSSAVHVCQMVGNMRQAASLPISHRTDAQIDFKLPEILFSHRTQHQLGENHLPLQGRSRSSHEADEATLFQTSSILQSCGNSSRSINSSRSFASSSSIPWAALKPAAGVDSTIGCDSNNLRFFSDYHGPLGLQHTETERHRDVLQGAFFVRDAAREPLAQPCGMLLPQLPQPLLALHKVRPGQGEGLCGDAAAVEYALMEMGPRAGEALDPSASPQWLQNATVLAGAISRTAAQMAIHPLDTLKTRMQVRLPTPQLRIWRAVMSCPTTRFRAIAAWAGAAGARDLLLGLGAAVVGVLPSSLIYFASEPYLRNCLARALSTDGDAPICRLTASAAAASLSALLRVPADVVKHRVQAYAFPNASHAIHAILTTRGPAGLYAGFGATLLRDAPEIIVQFTVYRQLKALLEQWKGTGGTTTTAAEHVLVGGAAGAAASLITTPLDVIKTQLQCGMATSVPAAVAHVLRAGGPAAFFGGLTPRLLQTTLCSAMFFLLFECSKTRLRDVAGVTLTTTPVAATGVSLTAATVPLPQRRRLAGWWQWRHSAGGSEVGSGGNGERWATAAAAEADGGGSGGDGKETLTPVALYAYAYAGAAVPTVAG